MSNYFDGLIRASGLAAGSYPPVATDHGITEIEVQHDAPPAATLAATPVSTAPAMAEAPGTNTRQTGIDTPPPVAATTPVPVTLEPAARAPAVSIGAKYEELVSTQSKLAPSEPSARPYSDSQDLGQAMVHAALRWVVADAQIILASPEIAPMPSPTLPIPVVDMPSGAIAVPATPSVRGAEVPPAPTAATILSPKVLTPTRITPIGHPKSTVHLPHRPSTTLQPTAKEEAVEIAIGAIHLRVDSPPPQTVVQAPAPTPRPPVDRPPPRSALTRRALRRL